MKISMKITERDKKLLVFLAAFLVFVGVTVLGILPAHDWNNELEGEITAAEQMKSKMDETILTAEASKSSYKKLQTEFLEESAGFYDLMENQGIDRTVTSEILACGLEIQNMTITQQADPVEIPDYVSAGADNEDARNSTKTSGNSGESDQEKSDYEVYAATVLIDVKGSRAQIQKLIDQFSSDPGIRIMTIDYTRNSESEEECATIGIELYMCEKE